MTDQQKKAWRDYCNGMKYKDIAEKHGVSLNTVKSWKKRHAWTREKGAPKKPEGAPKKAGAPRGNKNAIGNKGGGAPVGNSNASTHGFFRTIFPDDEETLGIIDAIMVKSPVDILHENIVIKYAAIARAQKIMFVIDKDELIKEVRKTETYSDDNMTNEKEEYEIQFAWDRHATFLNAQSRAMAELRSLIKDFMLLSGQDDQRRLQMQQMELGIEKAEIELGNMRGDTDGDPHEQVRNYEEALNATVEDVFTDDEVEQHEED
ncbi:phage terminase small subunit [Geomicrobium sediminis]|uniref:Uncharacterized protein YjcR n=1 Tax=Geomicrobium sediminis TaxID=1347788 RepID=A0ABS2PEY1_9BACL|nr:phage terminase small subunit [Geomicrobium sediminis]MBM7633842.1 uncharacterized protein YjcR [Geomicrobium sediminis]